MKKPRPIRASLLLLLLTVSARPATADSRAFEFPALLRENRQLTIRGPFDGFAASTRVRVAGHDAEIVEETSEKVVAKVPSLPLEDLGPITIELEEAGQAMTAEARLIGVAISTDSELGRGTKTALRLRVTGLAGIDHELELELVNQSPKVVRLKGGERQMIVIPPGQVRDDGSFEWTGKLRGRRRGTARIQVTLPAIPGQTRRPPAETQPGVAAAAIATQLTLIETRTTTEAQSLSELLPYESDSHFAQALALIDTTERELLQLFPATRWEALRDWIVERMERARDLANRRVVAQHPLPRARIASASMASLHLARQAPRPGWMASLLETLDILLGRARGDCLEIELGFQHDSPSPRKLVVHPRGNRSAAVTIGAQAPRRLPIGLYSASVADPNNEVLWFCDAKRDAGSSDAACPLDLVLQPREVWQCRLEDRECWPDGALPPGCEN